LLPNDPLELLPSLGHRHDRQLVASSRRGSYNELPRLQASASGVRAPSSTRRSSTGRQQPLHRNPEQMVRRVCRDLGQKRKPHRHQRRSAPLLPPADRRRGDRSQGRRAPRSREARRGGTSLGLRPGGRQSQARCQARVRPPRQLRFSYGVRVTPKARSFPWVVSDFSLIDAIESGIVKVPRVPVADDQMAGEQPTYRDLCFGSGSIFRKRGAGQPARVLESPSCPKNCKEPSTASTGTTRSTTACGSAVRKRARRGRRPRVHRCLQQHQCL